MNRGRISRKLEFAARTILATLAPKLSRIVRIVVRFQDDADTASTDGNVFITMPRSFAGAPIPEDAPVTLGLLAHEIGHWVQPLDKIAEIAQSRGAPHWLANVAMDIHVETFIEAAFPSMKRPLQATRKTAASQWLDKHLQNLSIAVERDDFRTMAKTASLVARLVTDEPWVNAPYKDTHLDGVEIPERLIEFLSWMRMLFDAVAVSPDQLPEQFEYLLNIFPELLEQPSLNNGPTESQDGQNDHSEGDDESGGDSSDASQNEVEEAEDDAQGDGNDDESHVEGDSDEEGGEDENKDAEDDADGEDDGDTNTNAVDGDDGGEDGEDNEDADGTDAGGDDSDDADGESEGYSAEGDANGEDEGDKNADHAEDTDNAEEGDGGGAGRAMEDEGEIEADEDMLDAYPESEFDALGDMLREEIQRNTGSFHPVSPTIRTIEIPASEPFPYAQRLARALRPRFQSPHAKLEVTAPGRLDRLEMARGAPVPLRMDVRGHEAPDIKVVLALDVSGSMFSSRIWPAQTAAQAIALAVKEAGGEVVAVLFDHRAFISPQEDDSLLFSRQLGNFRGNTSFLFLGEVWRRWPQHQVLMVTDGQSYDIPTPLPQDRERTSVILIGSYADVSEFAARSVHLSHLDKLASVLAVLLPDRRL